MFFREVVYPSDYRATEAAHLVLEDVYDDRSKHVDAPDILSAITHGAVNYCMEDFVDLLAVGSIGKQCLRSGVALFDNIAVARCVRGAGVGSRLIRYLEDEARDLGANIVKLTSLQSAVGFYEKLNYQPINPSNPLELGKVL